jgi:nitrous oxidase accessory protein NosD
MHRMANHALLALAYLLTFAVSAYSSGLTPGEVRSHATIHSLGVEWDITGDDNHDAVVMVQYRAHGSSAWKQALPLLRIDYNGYNMLAGSIFFLEPGTTYEVQLDLSDPDGGSDSRTLTVATRSEPRFPAGGRTLHVVPGTGGGDGSAVHPWKGIYAAQSVAQPGDIFLVHAGNYGGRIVFNKPGTIGNYIVWKGVGDGDAIFNGVEVAASHVWLEGLDIRDVSIGLKTSKAPEDVVVSRNIFTNCHYCIYLNHGGRGWYIADNIIIGNEPVDSNSLSGEGVELNHTSDHVVAYNRISHVADGISYPHMNVDIYGNDIFDTSDDGIELDYGYANIRVWGNRIHNAVHNGISFQPMNSAPWYIIRNQIVNSRQSPLKLRTLDRVLLAHNTMVGWKGVQTLAGPLRKVFSRNNLWSSVTGSFYVWEDNRRNAPLEWRSDLDYDGFDWHHATSNVFKWNTLRYPDLASFSAATGLESHGIRIRRETCFETYNVPAPPPASVPPQFMTLKGGCEAIDAGAILANINDGYVGNAPDLGAYEYGSPLPQYGPRAINDSPRDATLPAMPTRFMAVQ